MTSSLAPGSGPSVLLHVQSDVERGYDELMAWSDIHHRVALARPGWKRVRRFDLGPPTDDTLDDWRILTVYELATEVAAALRNEPDHSTPPVPPQVAGVRRRRAVFVEAGDGPWVRAPSPGGSGTTIVHLLAEVPDKDVVACTSWFATHTKEVAGLRAIGRRRAFVATEVDVPAPALHTHNWLELYDFSDAAAAACAVQDLLAPTARPSAMAAVELRLYRQHFALESADVVA